MKIVSVPAAPFVPNVSKASPHQDLLMRAERVRVAADQLLRAVDELILRARPVGHDDHADKLTTSMGVIARVIETASILEGDARNEINAGCQVAKSPATTGKRRRATAAA